ncbi:MAG: HDOD domain-containing protein, partial [Lentisphaerota bacterium]
ADYEKGMSDFHDYLNSMRDHYLAQQSEKGMFVKVELLVTLASLNISVINNAPVMETERRRIHHKMTKAAVYNSIVEVLDDIQDATESAGLGLVTVIMILRKLGVPEHNFHFSAEKDHTRFDMVIPLSLVTDEETELISHDLISEIDTIPQFPKSILSLQKLLKDPKTELQKVSQVVRRDPSLTMEVLRMSNSAYYRRMNKISNVELAVSILGIRGIGSILQSFGARRALDEKYPGPLLENLWNHSGEIASITSMLCHTFKLPDEEEEIAYVGGLLHDIGKIVLEGRHPSTFAALKEICSQKKTSAAVAEDLIEGVNHALIGAKMAEKWNIPEKIVDTIRFSRTPLSAPEESRRAVKMIYLAHLVYFKVHGESKEYEAAESILEEFGFGKDVSLDDLAAKAQTETSS